MIKRESEGKNISMWATKSAWLDFTEGSGTIPSFYPLEEVKLMFGKEYKEMATPVVVSVHITGTVY